ncbi:MAG: glycosyltransferase [Clostridium sp.]|nr:glycosyltransferase [Prevotella sp.]MCM1429484.1 glycosyltransferase [Clostridium sp.]MCM1476100.1 glycosyltransferase [Muribaculaceae bacterium]
MTFVFVSNFIHHHQVGLADALFAALGGRYAFVVTSPLPEWLAAGGYGDFYSRPYVVRLFAGEEEQWRGRRLISEADVVVYGDAPEELVRERQLLNRVTFQYSERWFKRGRWRLLKPRNILTVLKRYLPLRSKRCYLLCASAYGAGDARIVGAYPGKCFKFGYFTPVPSLNIDDILKEKRGEGRVRLLYVARFLKLKHPEMVVELAAQLKSRGIDFEIDMYGSGEELDNIRCRIETEGLSDCVHLKGNLPNERILEEMRRHHIFLFTSDRNEGWGAVVGEAMANGCMVIAGSKIGSVPFLLKDGENGLIFKDRSDSDLLRKTLFAIEHREERERMTRTAYATMRDEWSAEVAAERLLRLASGALTGKVLGEKDGPCSMA